MDDRNKSTVTRFLYAMSEGDSATAAECLGPGAIAITKGHNKLTGATERETIITLVGSIKNLVPTGLGIRILTLIAEGDIVIAEFEGDGVTCEGRPYHNQYCMVFKLADGKIVRSHEYFCTVHAEDVLWPIIAKANLIDDRKPAED